MTVCIRLVKFFPGQFQLNGALVNRVNQAGRRTQLLITNPQLRSLPSCMDWPSIVDPVRSGPGSYGLWR